MEALGRTFNTVFTAAGAWVNVRDCSGVTFLCYNTSSDTLTLTEAKDASSTGAQSPTNLLLTTYYTTKVDGTAAWTKHTQAAANTLTAGGSGASAVTCVYVDTKGLDDQYDYIKLAVGGATTVTAILHDLTVQRGPANLVAPGV